MDRKSICCVFVAALAASGASEAGAAVSAAHLGADEDGALVAEDGAALRAHINVTRDAVPAARLSSWQRFAAQNPGQWRALWDEDVGTALRVYGRGVAAPGSSSSAASAESFALNFAAAHTDLLLPGGSLADFVVVSNVVDGSGVRSVGLLQYRCGYRVVGGQLSFRFKNDRLFVMASEVFPDVPCLRSSKPVTAALANARADSLIGARYGESARAIGTAGEVVILPLVRASGRVDYALARPTRIDSQDPIGSWEVWIDANSGEPLARRQRLAFAEATLRYRVPERYWAGARAEYNAHQTSVIINGQAATTNLAGAFTWAAGNGNVSSSVVGPRARVINEAGAAAGFSASVANGGTALWDSDQGEFIDAQVTTYVHSLVVKEWLKSVAPGHPFYAAQLPATVNKAGSCNAFSDGTSINFLRAGNGCGNTGRIADVVYHEFGHSMHNHSLVEGVGGWDQALSEGLGDFLSATITGDPAVGPGFFGEGSILRHCDPAGTEQMWPRDVGAVHHTGKIYCGTMFDLRKNLIAALGEADGVATTDRLFYESFRRASSIPTTYVEVLAADDDDGNLENGTPNECAINEAYVRHGMGDPDRAGTPPLSAPTLEGLTVTLRSPASEFCPGGRVESAVLEWRAESDPSLRGVVDFGGSGEELLAQIPGAAWGSVIRYQVRAAMEGGQERVFPDNLADDYYQVFVGEGEAIMCDSFDGPSQPVGWEHGLASGDPGEGADDWQWGQVFGNAGSADPSRAYSGANVWGNDLGGGNFNGTYQPNKGNFLRSPSFDAGGYDVVRLQYRRWLNVEDGEFDVASISLSGEGGDSILWSNLASGATNHTDREWRFHDVDLTSALAGGSGRITFSLATDGGFETGGWTLDDFCIIGYNLPVCGDGAVTGDESCDDGNTAGGDGCGEACQDETDPGDPNDPNDPTNDESSGCGCQSGTGNGPLGLVFALFLVAGLRRRRR